SLTIPASGGVGGKINATEGTAPTAVSGHDILYADSTAHCLELSDNGAPFACIGSGGGSGFPITLGSTSIAASSTTTSVSDLTLNGTVPAKSSSTIQAAVTAAQGATGSVSVPTSIPDGEQNYPSSEIAGSPKASSSYNNYLTTPVNDLRDLNHDASLLQALDVGALSDMTEQGVSSDLAGFAKCASLGACKIAVIGNSIHLGTSGVAPDEGYFSTLVSYLKKKFPSVTWTAENFAIGGSFVQDFNNLSFTCQSGGGSTNFYFAPATYRFVQYAKSTSPSTWPFMVGNPFLQWTNGCTSSASWASNVESFNPDVVILGFGENDYSVGSSSYASSMQTAITTIKAWKSPSPTIILATDASPNPNWSGIVGGTVDPAQYEAIPIATRDIAAQDNLLLADADRLYNVYAYGIDPSRTHYREEISFGTSSGVSYSADWGLVTGYSGTFPAITSSGTPSATLTWASGNAGMLQRFCNPATPGATSQLSDCGRNFDISAQFTESDGDNAAIFYRMQNGAQTGYELVTSRATTSGTSTYTFNLYYATAGTRGSSLATGTCSLTSTLPLTIILHVLDAHTQAWCSSYQQNDQVKVIDVYDYTNIQPGAFAIGFGSVFTVGDTITNEDAYYGAPMENFTPLVSIPSLLGLQTPPGFGGSYSPTGDFDTNYLSFGGDGLHHPSYLGLDAFELASFAPVVRTMALDGTIHNSVSIAHQGSTGNFGGLRDNLSGGVDFVDGPTGGRIMGNNGSTVMASWDDNAADVFLFGRQVSAPSYKFSGSAPSGTCVNGLGLDASNNFIQTSCPSGGGGPASTTTITVANAGTTGTTANTLTKLTGVPSTAVIASTSDTGGIVGITTSGAGTTGSATITTSGLVNCTFSSVTTAGDYVQISTATAGDCLDIGNTYPSSGQVIGRVLTTNASAGTYQIDLFPSEIKGGSGASSGNYVNLSGSVTFSGCTLQTDGSCRVTTAGTAITISSIPSGYNTLKLTLYGQNTGSSSVNILLTFNGDTGAHYNQGGIYTSTGTNPGNYGNAGTSSINVCQMAYGSFISQCTLSIAQYAQTTFPKAVTDVENTYGGASALAAVPTIRSGDWATTGNPAVTSLTFTTSANNFAVGTSVTIYGTN
ncbi:hypothetical protein KGP36_06100, partial [Patescibacteria group bacterium]|nr:hypothetical protein [Patescibacteria group bacterium]